MKYKIKKGILLFSILLSISFLLPIAAAASEPRKAATDRVIRVSCPLQFGLFEVDENGTYSGYTYEYLMKIAQRTGWSYEFHTYEATDENLLSAMEQVRTGEVDLMGGMVYSEALAETYEFTSAAYGASNFVLVTDEKNKAVNERTYYNYSNLRVALNESAKKSNKLFDDFCKEKGIAYQPVYTDSGKRDDLVKNGEADVFISKDIVKNDGFKVVTKFSSQPFYFTTAKGNTPLTEELSRIITEINSSDPYYMQKLHEKYFKQDSDYQLSLTAEELDYLNNMSSVRMVILTNRAPIQDYDPKNGTYSGIIVDIIKKMAAESGLPIEFIPADNLEQARQLLDEGKADAFAGFPYDYTYANQYSLLLSSPIFTMPVVRLSNINGQANSDEMLVSTSIKIFEGGKEIRYVEDIGEIFDLVNRGEYKEAFVNGYLAQHYMEQKSFSNLVLTQVPYSNYELSIGVYQNTDLRLMSILEQMISKIKTSDIEDIVYQNTVYNRSINFFEIVRRNPLEFFVPALIVLFLFSALLLVLFFKTKRLNKMIFKEKSRYQEISSLDKLAQTYNNDTFKQMSKEYLTGADESPSGAFFVCDIDNFKNINDTYGHLMGDEVIHALGKLLRMLFRGNDLVGRLGGDEFVVLMKGVTDQDAIAERCKGLLNKCRTLSGQCDITLSIGVAVFSGSVSFDELFKAADNALYVVKNRGKNGYEIVTEPIEHT